MLRTTPLWEAYQVISLKQANRDFIREFCVAHGVDADLDIGVDGVDFFESAQQLHEALGWWRHCPRPLLRMFGVRVLVGAEEMHAEINLARPVCGNSSSSSSSSSNSGGFLSSLLPVSCLSANPMPTPAGVACIRLERDFDTIGGAHPRNVPARCLLLLRLHVCTVQQSGSPPQHADRALTAVAVRSD